VIRTEFLRFGGRFSQTESHRVRGGFQWFAFVLPERVTSPTDPTHHPRTSHGRTPGTNRVDSYGSLSGGSDSCPRFGASVPSKCRDRFPIRIEAVNFYRAFTSSVGELPIKPHAVSGTIGPMTNPLVWLGLVQNADCPSDSLWILSYSQTLIRLCRLMPRLVACASSHLAAPACCTTGREQAETPVLPCPCRCFRPIGVFNSIVIVVHLNQTTLGLREDSKYS
jgi:hypothetical protein